MAWGTIDAKEFEAFVERVGAQGKPQRLKRELSQSVRQVGSKALRGVKNRTPVDTGTLRRGWELKGPTISSSDIVLTMLNNIEYAQYVESGHRTRSGGWVSGSHMLMKTLFEVDNQMSSLLTPAFQKYLQGLM
ncbi:HK97 gp10 family phage protein [Lactiplantibacillus plajomi]|uniref:HK97 gp10 family phage protein n=1 Tax=Lactiplantibacillus plajomi TaxID=1457217 RepID=A0ABV6K0V6_9LACO|nr:HK97 gp10 family phage protein [Lactiplantibacillus plajomi]